MTFAPVHLRGSGCRTKPDQASRSGRGESRCALESAAARRHWTRGLGRYLCVERASCRLGSRALEAIKTCRLELTEKRRWVSFVFQPLLVAWIAKNPPLQLPPTPTPISIYIFFLFLFFICVFFVCFAHNAVLNVLFVMPGVRLARFIRSPRLLVVFIELGGLWNVAGTCTAAN